MQRFDWAQVRSYWETHGKLWRDAANARDVDALQNVCLPHEPLWLNEHIGRIQRLQFRRMLKRLPKPGPDARALDVGCGSGRWSALLSENGYRVTGIDLQESLVELNRRRYPHITFHCGPAQECPDRGPYDLINHVSVVQHLPFDQQDILIAGFRSMMKPGGCVLALEDVRSQGPHVFANTIAGWIGRFGRAGFECLTVRRYDYSLVRMGFYGAMGAAGRLRGSRSSEQLKPESFGHFDSPASAANPGGLLRRMRRGLLRCAVWGDDLVEPMLVRLNPSISSCHCAFIFRAK